MAAYRFSDTQWANLFDDSIAEFCAHLDSRQHRDRPDECADPRCSDLRSRRGHGAQRQTTQQQEALK